MSIFDIITNPGLPDYILQLQYQSIVGSFHVIPMQSEFSLFLYIWRWVYHHVLLPLTYHSLSLLLPRMYEIEPPPFPTHPPSPPFLICFHLTPNVNGVYRTQCGSHLSVTRWKICILWCTGWGLAGEGFEVWKGWNIPVTMGAQLGVRYLCQILPLFPMNYSPPCTTILSYGSFMHCTYLLPCNFLLGLVCVSTAGFLTCIFIVHFSFKLMSTESLKKHVIWKVRICFRFQDAITTVSIQLGCHNL